MSTYGYTIVAVTERASCHMHCAYVDLTRVVSNSPAYSITWLVRKYISLEWNTL